mgnify:CR=1 FL=1
MPTPTPPALAWGPSEDDLEQALAIAAQALTGQALGAGDRPGVRAATATMMRWGLGSGIVLGVLVAWLGNRYWTFKDTRRELVHHEALIFLAVSAVSAVSSTNSGSAIRMK